VPVAEDSAAAAVGLQAASEVVGVARAQLNCKAKPSTLCS